MKKNFFFYLPRKLKCQIKTIFIRKRVGFKKGASNVALDEVHQKTLTQKKNQQINQTFSKI